MSIARKVCYIVKTEENGEDVYVNFHTKTPTNSPFCEASSLFTSRDSAVSIMRTRNLDPGKYTIHEVRFP